MFFVCSIFSTICKHIFLKMFIYTENDTEYIKTHNTSIHNTKHIQSAKIYFNISFFPNPYLPQIRHSFESAYYAHFYDAPVTGLNL